MSQKENPEFEKLQEDITRYIAFQCVSKVLTKQRSLLSQQEELRERSRSKCRIAEQTDWAHWHLG